MFMKTLTYIVLRLSPILKEVVTQGIAEGVFNTPFPLESAEILLASERVLGTSEGSLTELTALFSRDTQ